MVSMAVASLVIAGTAHAEPKHDPCACSAIKPGFFRRDALSGTWGGLRDDLHDDGVTVSATYAAEVFATRGLAHDAVVAGLAVLAIDADLATLVHDGLGAMHVSGLAIHGDGLSAELMDIYGVSNNVAPSDARLFEAWAEQPLGGGVTLRAGLLSADQEFVLAKHSAALLDATFGIISLFSANVVGPVYPVATPGASVRFEGERVTVRGALYDGDQHNAHGIPTALGEHAFAIGEVELLQTLKLGAWHHTARGNGYYAIASRQLDRYVGAFARTSVGPDQPVPLYIDTGIRIGPGPLRPKDFASVGLAFARADAGAQTVVEATYQLQVGWLTVQPDLQLLLLRERTAGIAGVRVTVAL